MKASDRKEIKSTKAAEKVVSELDTFREYFRKSKGSDPKRIHITQKQKPTLGIDTPFFWKSGIVLKLTTDGE